MSLDVEPYLALQPAPAALFAHLEERRDRVRYRVLGDGPPIEVTWEEHALQVRHVALGLQGLLEAGERAAVYAPNSVAWMASAMGIQAAHGVMVPVYSSSTAEQVRYILEHGDVRVLFVDSPALLTRALTALATGGPDVRRVVCLSPLDLDAALDAVGGESRAALEAASIRDRVESLDGLVVRGAALAQAEPGRFEAMLETIDIDRPGLMLYTSGTSGPPKGVPLTHRNLGENGADWLRCNQPVLHDDASDLLWLPMSHVFGFGEASIGNRLGWTTTLCSPAEVLTRLPEVAPTVLFSVPSVWEKIAILTQGDSRPFADVTGGRLTFCLSGGAGLKREVKEHFLAEGCLIIEGYGLTECSPTLTLNRPHDYDFSSVGKPLPSVELRLAPDGEILARGPSVFAGYHKDPEATARAFTEDGWFQTGDIGVFTEEGFLRIVDRKKDILVTAGGKNIAPANVEQRFADDPFIAHLVVYGDGRKYLVAGVWLDEARVASAVAGEGPAARETLVAERIELGNRQLARHETIKRFAIMDRPLTVENGLLTPTLKMRRKRIYEAFGAAFEALYA